MPTIGGAWCTCNLEPSETSLAQNKAAEIPASRPRGQSGERQMLEGCDLTTLADGDSELHWNAKPMWKPLAGRRGRTQWCDASARCGSKRYLCGVIRQRGLHHRHKWARRTSEDCHKGERRSGQRGKRSREYDRSTKSDRQIASTTKPRLRQCVTARQRPHFPLYKSQHPERCRRKAALKFSYYMTNHYFCKRKISPSRKITPPQ